MDKSGRHQAKAGVAVPFSEELREYMQEQEINGWLMFVKMSVGEVDLVTVSIYASQVREKE